MVSTGEAVFNSNRVTSILIARTVCIQFPNPCTYNFARRRILVCPLLFFVAGRRLPDNNRAARNRGHGRNHLYASTESASSVTVIDSCAFNLICMHRLFRDIEHDGKHSHRHLHPCDSHAKQLIRMQLKPFHICQSRSSV